MANYAVVDSNNIVQALVAADSPDGPAMIFLNHKIVHVPDGVSVDQFHTHDEKYNVFIPAGHTYDDEQKIFVPDGHTYNARYKVFVPQGKTYNAALKTFEDIEVTE